MANIRTNIQDESFSYNIYDDAQSSERDIPILGVFNQINIFPIKNSRSNNGINPQTDYEFTVVSNDSSGSPTNYWTEHRAVRVPTLEQGPTPGLNPVVDIATFFTNVGTGATRMNVLRKFDQHGELTYDVFFSYETQGSNTHQLVVLEVDDLSAITDFTESAPIHVETVSRTVNGKQVYNVFLLI